VIRPKLDYSCRLPPHQQARLEEIKSDWKTLDSKDLTEIEKISDKANRALTDARYWRTHSNPAV